MAGFEADDLRQHSATPLKRWWWENWFQPIARIGEVGNYEHVLKPADPLPQLTISVGSADLKGTHTPPDVGLDRKHSGSRP